MAGAEFHQDPDKVRLLGTSILGERNFCANVANFSTDMVTLADRSYILWIGS